MDLPGDSIGITDIRAYRECPRRFSYGMRRHVAQGKQSEQSRPEVALYGAVWANHYGTAIHVAIQATEDGASDEDAVQVAWKEVGHALEPGDRDLLLDDLKTYHERDYPNTRTVASEEEVRIPLMVHDGKQIYFRGKLDRLYERLDSPGTFVHTDYKSSKHPKSQAEVDADHQLWAYNWLIHEFWPECDQLLQTYDQLRYGQLPTQKSEKQRRQIKAWLIEQVTAILEDDDFEDDGMLEYRYNEWCPWCPILESCGVVDDLTDWSLVRIAALAPQEKVGRKKITRIDEAKADEHAERLEGVSRARKVLERYEDSVRDMLRQMPAEERARLGYDLKDRSRGRTFGPAAMERLYERLGPAAFFRLVDVTKAGLESHIGDDVDLLEWALALGDESKGKPLLQKRK